VATFEPQQIIKADEHRAQAGRRWLRLKTQGRCPSPLLTRAIPVSPTR
jgi:hypothetical protein